MKSSGVDLGVQCVHIVSGEDYVGKVVYDQDGDSYLIDRPIVVNVGFNPETQRFNISPMPLRPYLKKVEQLVLESGHVLWLKPVTEGMEKLWQQTTSDIIIPTGNMESPLHNE
jgi:hypothetical protein